MIRCKSDVLQRLKSLGFSSYRIEKEAIICHDQMQKIRHEKQISITTLNRLCELLRCQPGEVIDYVPDVGRQNPD